MLRPLNVQYLSNITDKVGLVSTLASNDRVKSQEVAQGDRTGFASLNVYPKGWFTGNIRPNLLNNGRHQNLFQSIFAPLSVILRYSGPCEPIFFKLKLRVRPLFSNCSNQSDPSHS